MIALINLFLDPELDYILDDKDLAQQIHLHLTGIAKEGYVRAQDIMDVMSTPKMKRYLGTKTGISK